MQSIDFFRAFLKNWREVGWPLQTSQAVAKKICEAIDFDTAQRIIEVGPGPGNVTTELLKCMRPDAELIVFEINPDLCKHLRTIPDNRLIVYNVSGFEMPKMLSRKADYVVSAIPIATLSSTAFEDFYQAIKDVLREGGSCIQLQLSLWSYLKLKRLFETVTVAFTLLNPPPMFLYLCKNVTAALHGDRITGHETRAALPAPVHTRTANHPDL
jgi:phosphatidylethanolamine/phosphatidyl-N-methylethanolamine N-methyltransferase